MEIEIGEYVRTNNGDIYKYDENNDKIFIDNFKKELDILKHSKNIIDLIEVRRLCEWKKNSSNNRNNCK